MKQTLKILFIFSTLILSACAKEKGTNIDASFSRYTDRFVYYAKSLGKPVNMNNVTISFSNSLGRSADGYEILGTCMRSGYGVPEVKINIERWSTADYYWREQLIFHELGHCVLGRDHTEVKSAAGELASIMNPFHLGESYKTYQADYIRELFTRFVPYRLTSNSDIYTFPAGDYNQEDVVTTQSAKVFATVSKTTTNENGVEFETFGCGGETHDHE